jgi:hypothetical protein
MNELNEADRKAIEEYLYKIDIDDFDTIYCKMAAEWGIKHARANDDPGSDWVASNILDGAVKRIKELEQIHDLEQEENIRLVEVIEDLEDKLKHNAEGWQNAVAEKDKYKDRVKELEAEVARLNQGQAHDAQMKVAANNMIEFDTDFQGISEADNNIILFSDGVYEFTLQVGSYWATVFRDVSTGTRFRITVVKHMPAPAEYQLETLQKENEGWDQQAQEVERLREEVANSKYPLHRQGLYNYIYGVTKGTVHEHSPHTQDIMRALQSPSSAKDTPDNYVASKQNGKPGHCFCAQVFGPDGKSILMIEPTKNQEVATKLAKDIAKFLNGRNALKR